MAESRVTIQVEADTTAFDAAIEQCWEKLIAIRRWQPRPDLPRGDLPPSQLDPVELAIHGLLNATRRAQAGWIYADQANNDLWHHVLQATDALREAMFEQDSRD